MRDTGRWYDEIDEMSMGDVLEFMDYSQEWPPAHVILKAAFLKDTGHHRQRSPQDEQATIAGMRSLLFGNAEEGIEPGVIRARKEVPAYLRDVVDWAEGERAKMAGAASA